MIYVFMFLVLLACDVWAENNPLDDTPIGAPITLPKNSEDEKKTVIITIDKKTCTELGGTVTIVGETQNEIYFSCVGR